eukprot:15472368-Alexandrium_andersonii.AAC.1
MFAASDHPRSPRSRADSASARNNGADRAPRELRRPLLRPFLGQRISSFERLKRCCFVCKADCGW